MGMDVIDRIKLLLEYRGVPQRGMKRALSDACNISYEAVRQWFSGSTANIKHDNLVAISREWQGSISWLLTGEGPMTIEEYRKTAIATAAGTIVSIEQTVRDPDAKYATSSPKAQQIISDIIALDNSGSLNESYLDMLQNILDAIPKEPNKSAESFRDT